MSIPVDRYVKSVAFFLLCGLCLLIYAASPALGQDSPVFEINITPQTEFVTAGNYLTYTVTVVNVGPTPVKYASIEIPIPQGTKFINTRHNSLKWFGGNPFADPDQPRERIVLISSEEVEAGERFTFDLIVEVQPETQQEIIVDNYSIVALEDRDSEASGSPVRTEVTPVPTPTPTSTPTPAPSATPSPTAFTLTPTITTQSATAIADRSTDDEQSSAAYVEQAPTETKTDVKSDSSDGASFMPLWAIVVLVAAAVMVGLIWYARRSVAA